MHGEAMRLVDCVDDGWRDECEDDKGEGGQSVENGRLSWRAEPAAERRSQRRIVSRGTIASLSFLELPRAPLAISERSGQERSQTKV